MKNRQDNTETSKVLPSLSQRAAQSPASTKTRKSDAHGKPPVHTRLERESSPTSVVSHPLSNDGRPTLAATPRVYMGEEGAEVSLSTPPQQAQQQQRPPLADQTNVAPPAVTPENNRRFVNMNSLLDADISPSPDVDENKEQHHGPSLGAQMLCGGGGPDCFSLGDDTDACALVNAPQASVERTITLLLSDPYGLDGWCHAWQAWFFFGIAHCDSQDENTRETKEDMKRTLRNRAYDLNSRSRRIRTLKDDLSPFDGTPPGVSASIPLTKTRSFSGHEVATRTSSMSSETSLNMSVVSLWESMPGCGQPDSESPAALRSREFAAGEDLCYDSDPEEITRRRPRHGLGNEDKKKDESFMVFNDTKSGRANKPTADPKSDLLIPRRLDSIFKDDDHARDAVQEFMNEKQKLIWHRSCSGKSKGTPQAMLIWIERGQQLNSGLIQPKLVWRPVKEYEGETQRLGLVTPSLESLEILDVSRILEVNRIDRKLYPFAKRKNCFLVESLDRKMMFEASSESERDRIVNGFKLVVARFASKVIVQDRSVLDEFFTSFLSAVPGEAPRWTQESKTLSLL